MQQTKVEPYIVSEYAIKQAVKYGLVQNPNKNVGG